MKKYSIAFRNKPVSNLFIFALIYFDKMSLLLWSQNIN